MSLQGGKKEVAKLAWPLAVSMISITLMGVVDTLLMGRVGTAEQAGVGLAATLFFFFISFFMGLVTGPQSLVSAAHGAKDEGRVKKAAGAGVVLGVLSGAIALGLMATAYRPLMEATVNDPEVLASAFKYLNIRLWGLPLNLLGMGLLCGIQGLGDTRSRMWISLIGNGINIALDFLLIFGWGPVPAMGEAGAALATVIGVSVSAVLYGVRYLQLVGRPVFPTREVFVSSVKLGLPMGIERLQGIFAYTVICFLLARVDKTHMAANEIVINIISVSFLPGFGIGEAGRILIGRFLGAGNPELAGRALRSARTLALWVMGFCGVVFALWGKWITSFFTRDPEVAKLAAVLMIFAAFFQLLDALATVHLCAMQGAGDAKFSLLITTASSWCVLLPLTFVFVLWMNMGASGAYLAFTVELAALALVTGWRVRGISKGKAQRMDLLLGQTAEEV